MAVRMLDDQCHTTHRSEQRRADQGKLPTGKWAMPCAGAYGGLLLAPALCCRPACVSLSDAGPKAE